MIVRLLMFAPLLLATPVTAEECFQIIAPVAPASTVGTPAAAAALKLNRCTGETWVLSLLNLPGKTGANAWRWTPISEEQHEALWPH
jgi:hypothetical protein